MQGAMRGALVRLPDAWEVGRLSRTADMGRGDT